MFIDAKLSKYRQGRTVEMHTPDWVLLRLALAAHAGSAQGHLVREGGKARAEPLQSGGPFSCPASPTTTPSDEAWSQKTLLVFLTHPLTGYDGYFSARYYLRGLLRRALAEAPEGDWSAAEAMGDISVERQPPGEPDHRHPVSTPRRLDHHCR